MMSAAVKKVPNCVLSVYPLTQDFKARIADLAGPSAILLTVGELRQKGLVGMVRHLRSHRVDRVYLPLEGGEGTALLPVLKMLAGLMSSRGVLVVGSDQQVERVKRSEALGSAVQLVRASWQSRSKMRRAALDVERLLKQPRIESRRPSRWNLLYLNANLWFGVKAGGSIGHVSGVINALVEAGHPVELASAGGRVLVREPATYTPLVPPAHFGLPWEYNFYRFHHDVVEQTTRIAEARDFGFIYQRLSICNFSGVEVSRRLGKPLILEYNGSEVWVAKNWGQPLRSQDLAEKVEQVNLRHAHLVVTISDVLRDELLARGVPPERIVTYPNCIDPATFDPERYRPDAIAALRQRHGIAQDAIVTTFVGTFGQWHGASVLAAAVREILDRHGDWASAKKLHFLFVGDGLKMPEVRKALGPHVEGPHVTMAGLVPQDQAPLYLAASDILAAPHVPNADGSRFFGSPTKLFEYMAMSKPIIASDLDQIGEVLSGSIRAGSLPAAHEQPADSPTALLAAPGSAAEIVAGVRFLVERPDWRRKLGANARRLALNKYTWHHHVAAILERATSLGLATDVAAPQEKAAT
jgi:glycosyltransferase involved in cell wall biosynthesis